MGEIVFYGAGRYARQNHKRFVEQGLVPVAYADKNANLSNEQIFGIDILSLTEVNKLYPNCILYLTVDPVNYVSVIDFLTNNGVVRERIKFAEDVEYYRGCSYIGTFFQTDPYIFQICCSPYKEDLKSSGNILSDLEFYNDYCRKLKDDLKNGNPTVCDGCFGLVEGYFPRMKSIPTFGLSDGFAGTRCNFKCCYCSRAKNLQMPNSERSFIDVLSELESKFSNEQLEINFAPGEFTICRDRDEVLKFFERNPWKCSFTLNGTGYSEGIVNLSKQGKVTGINVSLDAGTPQTYLKVKGVDCLEKVIENCKKYVDSGVNLQLKYIMLKGINDNEEDIDGFAEIAKQLNVEVDVSNDINDGFKRLEERPKDMIVRLLKKCHAYNLPIHIFWENFHPEDTVFLKTV